MRTHLLFPSLFISSLLQAQVPLAPGDVVRIPASAGRPPMEGQVRTLTADTLTIEVTSRTRTLASGIPGSSRVALAVRDIALLEVRREIGNHLWRGAAIGGGIGAAVGLVLGLAAEQEESFVEIGTGDIVTATLVAGTLGAVVGGIIGHGTSRHGWLPVSLAAGNATSLPVGGGTMIRLRLEW